jgi:hypothetical protein
MLQTKGKLLAFSTYVIDLLDLANDYIMSMQETLISQKLAMEKVEALVKSCKRFNESGDVQNMP